MNWYTQVIEIRSVPIRLLHASARGAVALGFLAALLWLDAAWAAEPAPVTVAPDPALLSSELAPPISQFTVGLNSREVNVVTLYILQFKLPDSLPRDAGFRVTFPANFGLDTLVSVFYADSDGVEPNPRFNQAPLRDGQSADFFLDSSDSTAIPTLPGSFILLKLTRIRNSTAKGSYQVALQVLRRDSTLLYGPTLSAPFSLAPAAAATMTVSPSAPTSVAAGRTVLCSATIKDTFGNTFDTATVTWHVEPAWLGLQTGPIFNARLVGTGNVVANYGSLEKSSGPITVRPGSFSTWDVQGLPASATAGLAVPGDSVIVIARDAFGNRKTDYLDSLYFACSDPQASLPATVAFPFIFDSLAAGRYAAPAAAFVLYRAGTDTIFVQGGGKTIPVQLAVAASGAVDFSVSAPDTVTAGQPFPVTASGVQDIYGNAAGGTIELYLDSADSTAPSGQPAFLPDLQAASGSGSVTVRVYKAGRYPILAMVDDTLRTTDSIEVMAAPAAQFALAIASPQVSGVPFASPSTITAHDAFGNVDEGYALSGRTVTIGAQNGDPMSQNTLAALLFNAGVADLAARGVTYGGRGGAITFVAGDGVAQGVSAPVDVAALHIDTVSFDQTEVRRGVDVLTGSVILRVQGVGTVTISSLSLETAYGSFPLSSVAPTLPHDLAGPGTFAYDFSWPVDMALPQSCVEFGVHAEGTFGAGAVSADFSGAPCVSVVSAAMPVLTDLAPDTVGYGAVRYLATISNDGIRGVTLDLANVRLLVDDSVGRVDTAIAESPGQMFLFPESTLVLSFLGMHASPFAGDRAFATLEMRGFESGRPFESASTLSPALTFRSAAGIQYVANSLSRDTLLLGQAATLYLRLANTGGVGVEQVRPESTFVELRGAADTAHLPLSVASTPLARLAALSDTLLAFELSAVEARLVGGSYEVYVQLVGEQNLLRFGQAPPTGDSIELVGEARIRIDSVWLTAPNAPRVSTNQAFVLSAKVSNQGLEPLDSVELALSADAGALFNAASAITTIPQSGSRTAEWSVTADVVPVLIETFFVDVTRAVGRFTGSPALVVPALDAQAAVQVQAPASVVVDAEIYLPPEAADLRVAAGSEFQIAARFLNLGEAQTGGGALRVSVTGGLVIEDSAVVTLPPGGDAIWRLTAPTADTTARIIVALEGSVDELNTSAPAAIEKAADTLDIEVAFEAPPLVVDDITFGSGQVASQFAPFTWRWSNPDPSGQFPILVKHLEVEMLAGRAGTLMDASQYLSGAELSMAGEVVPAAFSNGRIVFGVDSLRRIAPGDSEQVVLRVTPQSGADFSEFRFATRATLWSAVERFVSGAGLPVPVLDERGQSLNIVSPLAFRAGTAPANYPNPFRAGVENTQLVYALAADAEVTIVVFAADGREVWSFRAAAGTPGGRAGANSVVWDGRRADGRTVFDGVYFAHVQGGALDATLKIAVLK